MPQHSNDRCPRRKKTKRRHEKILEELIAQNFHKKGKEIVIQVQETQRPKQDNPKAKKTQDTD